VLTVREVTKNHRGGRLWVTDCRWDPAQVWWVVTLPPCRVKRATLLGVVQQQIVIVQCPLLQGLPVQISLLISPVWMMAAKVSNQDCRMRKDWWQICVVPVFSWWFVDVGNVVSADPLIHCYHWYCRYASYLSNSWASCYSLTSKLYC